MLGKINFNIGVTKGIIDKINKTLTSLDLTKDLIRNLVQMRLEPIHLI
jgi:hypothetical protein